MTDGQTQLMVFIAPEIGVELLHIIIIAAALHIVFRRDKYTLRLREYFFPLDVRHFGQRRKERIALTVETAEGEAVPLR